MFSKERNTPRWIIFLFDLGISLFALILAYLLRFNFSIPQDEIDTFKVVFPFVIGIRIISFLAFKTYSGIIRYTSTKDAQRIFTVITIGSAFFCVANIGKVLFIDDKFIIPFSVIVIDFMTTIFIMISFRIATKVLYFELKNPSKEKSSVIIFGAGEYGVITKRTLDRDQGTKYKVVAFVDDNKKKVGNKIERIKIHNGNELDILLESSHVDNLIISILDLSKSRKREIIETCLRYGVGVLTVPPITNWINGELSFNQIKNIRIEDLLGRDQINLDRVNIRKKLENKTILVTGAAGSIGSELVRQAALFKPKKIILLDQAESPLYELEFEILDRFKNDSIEIVIGDIRHPERLENVFQTFKPDIVYHAAAYKHVPLMETNPSEAIRTNILGTKHLVDLAIKYKVPEFVMISTDKAVNPTNVMGSSKRIAEIYAQASNSKSDTKFITTRFGNVLGSNGSVILLFKKQIEKGGPITVTHPEITRYFMTIPEACQLVLQASLLGQGGEIFIFDMGKSVKIIDLAKKMVKLAGLELGKDIQIKFTGLRPGEKLYEELLADKENTIPTPHPQIMVAKVREYEYESISAEIKSLISLYETQNNTDIVKKMKEIVPEFISKSSEFEKLDAK